MRRPQSASTVAISLILTVVAIEIVLRNLGRAYQERYWQQTTSAHVASQPLATVLVLGEMRRSLPCRMIKARNELTVVF